MTAMIAKTQAEESLGVSLPHRRMEEWKWTDLRRLVDKPFGKAKGAADKSLDKLVTASPLAKEKFQRVIIVNGVYDPKRSKIEGLTISQETPLIGRDDPLLTLSAKLGAKSLHLHFASSVEQTVEVLYVTSGKQAAVSSRLHVSVADGGSATLVETFVSDGDCLNVPVTTLELGSGARLDRVKVEVEGSQVQHLSHLVASLSAGAQYNDFTFNAGAALVRQNGDIVFNGQHANAKIFGSYLLKDKQHVDTRLVVDHKVPHCNSRELFKCVMDDQARGIFQGKVIVRPGAQKTDGKQSSHALLLSETAEFNAKPELEIYADDVVCGHGSTCGDLNHDHLFYLRARGIPEVIARAMLVEAFVDEAFEAIENEAIRETLIALVHDKVAR